MAVDVKKQSVPAEAPPEEAVEQEDTRQWDPPRGAAAFTGLMLAGYAIYLIYMWLTVISRG
ncbi:MAG: hypothetical protein IPK19_12170 [Chloroflexi bacterium]|nr:hypothetical protein [Chloroflexota bacterium]